MHFTSMFTGVSISVLWCANVCVCVCMCVRMCVCECMCVRMCVCANVQMGMWVCALFFHTRVLVLLVCVTFYFHVNPLAYTHSHMHTHTHILITFDHFLIQETYHAHVHSHKHTIALDHSCYCTHLITILLAGAILCDQCSQCQIWKRTKCHCWVRRHWLCERVPSKRTRTRRWELLFFISFCIYIYTFMCAWCVCLRICVWCVFVCSVCVYVTINDTHEGNCDTHIRSKERNT